MGGRVCTPSISGHPPREACTGLHVSCSLVPTGRSLSATPDCRHVWLKVRSEWVRMWAGKQSPSSSVALVVQGRRKMFLLWGALLLPKGTTREYYYSELSAV